MGSNQCRPLSDAATLKLILKAKPNTNPNVQCPMASVQPHHTFENIHKLSLLARMSSLSIGQLSNSSFARSSHSISVCSVAILTPQPSRPQHTTAHHSIPESSRVREATTA